MKPRTGGPEPSLQRRWTEMGVFVAASAVGIYAVGNAFSDLFGSAAGISLGWFAIAAIAILVLAAQMGRVHDAWPRHGVHTSGTASSDSERVDEQNPS